MLCIWCNNKKARPKGKFCSRLCYMRWYRNRNRLKVRTYSTEYKRVQRKKVYEYFGGCYCRDCGTTDTDILTIDHLKGGGQQHRKSLYKCGSGGGMISKFCSLLRKGESLPPDYEVVCRNCNWKRYLKNLRGLK